MQDEQAQSDGQTTLDLQPLKMSELVRNFDWAATALGPQSVWPDSLKATYGLC
jgi:hypothetical protein